MKALRDVFGDTLVSLGSTNPNVLVLDADLANSTKADKFAIAYPGRFLQMGIAEQNFVGVAVGFQLARELDPPGRAFPDIALHHYRVGADTAHLRRIGWPARHHAERPPGEDLDRAQP